ncbi:MAG: RGCVC family protein [Umezawaea sp.]
MADVQPNPSEPDAGGAVEATCGVCPHPWEDHDRIAKRFCTAMGASGDLRKCLCSGVSAGMTYSNSTRGPISG